MTKFKRAKRRMLEGYRTLIMQLLEDSFDKPWISCAFCEEYEYDNCRGCPVFLAEGSKCTQTVWWTEFAQSKRISFSGRKHNRRNMSVLCTARDKEDALVFLLARYGYIESLEE